MTPLAALLWKDYRILKRDRRFLVFLFAIPTLLVLLLGRSVGQLPGVERGADQVVPGFTVMFGFYIITYIGIAHYREHAWGAWTLIRSSGFRRSEMAIGIVLPYFILGLLQILILLASGVLVFGASLNGSIVGVVLIAGATEVAVAGLAITLINATSSYVSLQQINQVIVLIGAAISGALLPIHTMPSSVEFIAYITPQYWSVQGLKLVMSQHGDVTSVLPYVAVLAGGGLTLLILAFKGFDPKKSRRMPLR